MSNRVLIDGFNLFHRWNQTRGFFKGAPDINSALTRALGLLASALGREAKKVIVVLDGGLSEGNASRAGLKLDYAGAGRKADDVILGRVRRADRARSLTVVTTDRELGGNCRALGSRIMSVEAFIKTLGTVRPGKDPGIDDKPPPPTPQEVQEWLKFYGEAPDQSDSGLGEPGLGEEE